MLQAPGTDEEFLNTLKYVRPGGGFTAPFKIFSKIEVNGAKSHPFWQQIRQACPVTPGGVICPYDVIKWSPVTCSDVGWNFEKVLISRKGVPTIRYSPDAMADEMVKDIETLLAN